LIEEEKGKRVKQQKCSLDMREAMAFHAMSFVANIDARE
jgi:hypothetical protein